MKKTILVVGLFVVLPLISASPQEVVPQHLSDIVSGPLTLSQGPDIVLTCKTVPSGHYDPTAIYDCALTPGHTLDGLVRTWLSIQQVEGAARDAERRENLRFLERMQRKLNELSKTIDKDGKTKG